MNNFSQFTKIVADTADIKVIEAYRPQDATTNPSLILKNSQDIDFDTIHIPESGRKLKEFESITEEDILYIEAGVLLGKKILELIPGRISTEVPSRYSFHIEKTVALAHYILTRYHEWGIGPERVLIKIASTWEGIEAARRLEGEGVHCNMTLLFSLTQAIACAEAKVTLISPFVGRVYDWYRANPVDGEDSNPDPGVRLVREIYHYYKRFGYTVEIMGASFRTLKQILSLVGCDLLTISPPLLEELKAYTGEVLPMLVPESVEKTRSSLQVKRVIDQETFQWEMCSNPMATEKLTEGIRLFHKDFLDLNDLIKQKIDSRKS